MANDSSERFVLLNHLADEFAARYRRGERPSLQEYIDRYPELADDIREFFPTLVEMEQVKDDRQAPIEQAASHTLPTLERLGDFRIIREIGRGGMGVVYEAEQVSLGRRVALKVLPQQLLTDAKTKRRFEREARAAAKLHHTNIVPVFGVGEHEGLPYYVMQFIRGLGLDEVLGELQRLQPGKPGSGSIPGRSGGELRVSRKEVSAADVARSLMTGHFTSEPDRENDAPVARADATVDHAPNAAADPAQAVVPPSAGRLSDTFSLSSSSVVLPGTGRQSGQKLTYWQSVARIGIQVADALEYAHRQGILHRDTKPSNLLLDTTGTVWVTDFGLAKANDQQNLTHTGDILGTLRYMPPEAFDGKSDARSDVYALGLTLYELLAFRPAFDEKERNRLIKQVTTAEPARLDRLNREVPRDLVTIVHKAIERDPARRYPTAAELEADLKRFLDDEPIQARRQTQLERYWRWARHNPGIAALSGVLAAVLVLVTVASLLAAGHFNRLRENEAQAAQNERDARKAEAVQRQIAEEKTKEAKAYGLVQLALNVDTPKVPPIIAQMTELRQWTDPMLREVPENSPQKFHASLALAPVDPGQVDYLLGRLLEADPQGVLPVIRDALDPYKNGLRDRLWAVAAKPEKGKESQRLRAAAALAMYDPKSVRWANVQVAVVNDLLAVPATHSTAWKESLRPARLHLLAPLSVVYRSINRPALATNMLADYAADQPQVLADLLMDADDKQFAVIYPKLTEQGERVVRLLTSEFAKEPPPPPVMSDWTVRFHRWQKVGTVPADWGAVLKSPVLDVLRMPRLHLPQGHAPPTPKVSSEFFAVVATAEVTLGDGEYILRATHDDGIRVWLDNELVIDDWQAVRTNSVTVETKRGRHVIKVEFFQSIGPYVLDVELTLSREARDKLAKRQANAAVALLRMNQPAKVWPLLRHSPDPTVRSYLIHRLSPLGADARAIATQLDRESDLSIRRALLLSLGDFTEKDFTLRDRQALLPKVRELYQTAADPGLHAASEWLLRTWKEEAWLNQVNEAWAKAKKQQDERLESIRQLTSKNRTPPHWYVNAQGQTLVVIPGPVEFWMGSGPAEEGRAGGLEGKDELHHWQRIGRSFAIASKEVTVEQFLRFRKEHPVSRPHAPSDNCPVNHVTWYDAAAYCNWLSEQEGIPPDQWCYEPNKEGKYDQGMKLATNYLQRTGYRLPTEAEWEYACRAGAATRFSFGESEELLPKYVWFNPTSANKVWPVGSRKPNDLGLFDMHGNAWEWCQEAHKAYSYSRDGTAPEDTEDVAEIPNGAVRALRGGSFDNAALHLRSASRNPIMPTHRNTPNVGFRPARTLPFSSFDRYAAARAATLAAAGQGKDKLPLDDAAKAKLRRQALDWLRAELTDWSLVQPPRLFVARNLWHWQQDRDLAGIRDQAALAKLPPEEQKAFTQLWADIAKSAEPANHSERLDFARVAVLIAAGQSKDELPFDAAAKAKMRGLAFDWLMAELPLTADRAGKARIIAAAAPLPGLLLKLAESAPKDGRFQAELTRHYAERGNKPLANAARTRVRALFEGKLAKEPGNAALAWELADLLLIDTTCWTVLTPTEMKTANGSKLELQNDGSVFVHPPVKNDTYSLVFQTELKGIKGLRLEALADARLPGGGPGRADNGNFVLSGLTLQAAPVKSPDQPRAIDLRNAWADFSQMDWDVRGIVDGKFSKGWAILPESHRDHVAVFETAEEVGDDQTIRLTVRLHHQFPGNDHLLGRFRLSVSDDPAAVEREQKRFAAKKLTDPWLKLAAAYALNGRNDKATEYFAKAFQTNPKLGDYRQAQHRYGAARAAALAAGQSKGEPQLDAAAKAKLRGQALDWLKAELTAWNTAFNSGPAQDRPAIVQTLNAWRNDADLANLRDAAALARLPGDEQKEWQALWAEVPELWTVVPTSNGRGRRWHYTTQKPPEGWQMPDFDDKQWKQGIGAFGKQGAHVGRTEWKTADIWLRREFTMPEGNWDGLLVLFHDDDAEVYVNGVLALKVRGSVGDYVEFPLSAAARMALKPGKNVIAVHCHNTGGEQYIDVGIVAVKGNAGRLAHAQIAFDRRQYAFATQLWAAALASDPKVGDDRLAQHRARVALLAAAGQGQHELPPDNAAKARLRGQAHDWLKAELAWLGAQLERDRSGERAAVQAALLAWQKDGFLAGIRDAALLAKLPANEQKACAQLWADVTALLMKAEGDANNAAFRLPGVGRPNSWMAQDRQGKWLAIPTADKVAIFDARTGELVRTLAGHTGRVYAVAFSPDGKFLAGGNWAGNASTVKVWDLKTGAVTANLDGAGGEVNGVTFSGDGKRLFGSVSRTGGGVRMWDATGKLVRTFKASGDTWGLYHPALSPDGKRVVCNDTPQTVKVWEIEGDNPPVTLGGHTSHPWYAAYSPDGKLLATGSDSELLLWDAGTLKLVKKIATPAGWLAFAPNSKSLLTAQHHPSRPLQNDVVTQWDLATYEGEPLPPLTGRTGFPVYHLSPDGKRLYTQVCDGPDAEGRIRVYDAATGADIEVFSLQALAKRFPALLRGEDKPANNTERLDFAQIAYTQKKFAFATRLWAEALAIDPKLGDDLTPHRYHAARAAALAAAGQGKDEPPLDDAAKAKLRRQALEWLKAELTGWSKLQPPQLPVVRTLWQWQQDSDLAGIRDQAALAKLPAEAQKAFTQLWADVKSALPAAKQVEEVRKELKTRNPRYDGRLTPTIEKAAVTGLNFDNNPTVSDLTPLNGMPLKSLGLMHTGVTDLTPLRGMPLETLMLWGWRGSDLTPLKGMPLTWLNCGGGGQKLNLAPLAGLPLDLLCINHTQVSDLGPLKDVPLTQMLCSNTPVSDLTPLRKMRLRELYLTNGKVSDLAPIQGMPLTVLAIEGTSVTDLSPLKGMPLELLRLTPKNITRGLEILRAMKSLKTIGIVENQTWPAAEFWARYDKGEFKK